ADDVELPREVKEGRGPRERDARRLRHAVGLDDGFGGLQRPRVVVDVGTREATSRVDGEEAVALGEPVIERAVGRWARIGDGAVASAEEGRVAAAIGSRALVVDPAILALVEMNRGVEVREVEPGARGFDGESTLGV